MKKKPDRYRPSPAVLIKLGSVAVHAEELVSEDGCEVDAIGIRNLMMDRDLRRWVKSMGALLPVKRVDRQPPKGKK
jgi:hypothetical protein